MPTRLPPVLCGRTQAYRPRQVGHRPRQLQPTAIHLRASSLYDLAWPLAQRSGRPFYDSLCLALALTNGCRPVRADLRFFNALADTPWTRPCLWVEDVP